MAKDTQNSLNGSRRITFSGGGRTVCRAVVWTLVFCLLFGGRVRAETRSAGRIGGAPLRPGGLLLISPEEEIIKAASLKDITGANGLEGIMKAASLEDITGANDPEDIMKAASLEGITEADGLEDIMEWLDLEAVEHYLSGRQGETELRLPGLAETMKRLISGDWSGVGRELLEAIRESLFAETSLGSRLAGQILLLGILSSVFRHFSSVFQTSQISETGFFVTYLLLFAFLTASLTVSMQVAAEAVEVILGFMKVLMPAYFLAVAFSGASVSAAAMYEMTMLGMTAGEWLLHTAMIPMVRVFLVLAMAGNLVKENHFSRLTGLVEQMIGWGMKTLLGAVLGVHFLQTLVLPYVDSMKNGAVQKLVGMIPGIGQGAMAVSQMFLGAGVLIRNSMGAAAAVILAVMAAVPVIKLLFLTVLCQGLAAVLEPVCDKRFLDCVSAAARGHKMLLKIVVTAVFLLVITVALAGMGTNAAYFG